MSDVREDLYELRKHSFAVRVAAKVVSNDKLRADLLSLAELLESGELCNTTHSNGKAKCAAAQCGSPTKVTAAAEVGSFDETHIDTIARSISDNNGPMTITSLHLMTMIEKSDLRKALKHPRFCKSGREKWTLTEMFLRDCAYSYLAEQGTPQTLQSIAVKLKCGTETAAATLDHCWFKLDNNKYSIAQT